MVVLLHKDGDIHVHAPFDDKILMNQFLVSIKQEQARFEAKQDSICSPSQ